MSTLGWAIVTGASGGIGTVFTRALAQRDLSVLAVARAGASLTKIADEVRDGGGRVETLGGDLASTEGVNAVIAKAQALENVDLLVNNAGLSTSGRFLEYHGHRARHRVSGQELSILITLLVVAGSVLWWVSRDTHERVAATNSANSPTASAPPFNPPPHSIAVLPFVNMSGTRSRSISPKG